MHDTNTQALACRFAIRLREALDQHEWAAMVEKNETPQYAWPVCASHDFIDANMVMDDAFHDVMGRNLLPDEGGPTDEDVKLWNDAWAMARRDFMTLQAVADVAAYLRVLAVGAGVPDSIVGDVLEFHAGPGETYGGILADMPVDSTCGEDCARVARNAAALCKDIAGTFRNDYPDMFEEVLHSACRVMACMIRG